MKLSCTASLPTLTILTPGSMQLAEIVGPEAGPGRAVDHAELLAARQVGPGGSRERRHAVPHVVAEQPDGINRGDLYCRLQWLICQLHRDRC